MPLRCSSFNCQRLPDRRTALSRCPPADRPPPCPGGSSVSSDGSHEETASRFTSWRVWGWFLTLPPFTAPRRHVPRLPHARPPPPALWGRSTRNRAGLRVTALVPAPALPRRPAPCRASSRVSRSSCSLSRSRWIRAASSGPASPRARASSRRRKEGAANSSSRQGRALSPRRGCRGHVPAAPLPTGAARGLRGGSAAARQPCAARRTRESSRMPGWARSSAALPSPALLGPETPERARPPPFRVSGSCRRGSALISEAVGNYRGSAGGKGRRGSANFVSRDVPLGRRALIGQRWQGRAKGRGSGSRAPPRCRKKGGLVAHCGWSRAPPGGSQRGC